jgi:hypothetical protein
MGLAIALVVVLITFLSGYFFLAKTWWFPVDITRVAHCFSCMRSGNTRNISSHSS